MGQKPKGAKEGKLGLLHELALLFLMWVLFRILITDGFGWVIWLAGVPYVLFLMRTTLLRAGLFSAVWAIALYPFAFDWMRTESLPFYLAGMAMYASFYALLGCVCRFGISKVGNYGVLVLPAAYALLMKAYSFTPFGSFWADWAMFSPFNAPLIAWVGSVGVTFIIVLFHTASAFLLKRKERVAAVLFFVCVCALTFGTAFHYTAAEEKEGVTVAIIQGNFPYVWEWRVANAQEIFDAHIALSKDAAQLKPDIIVWPEYALAINFASDKGAQKMLQDLASETGALLIVGSFEKPDTGPVLSDIYSKKYDLAVAIWPNGSSIQTRRAAHVAPNDLDDTLEQKGEVRAFLGELPFGVSLCYEEMQSSVSREIAQQGSQMLFFLSNNAQFDNTRGIHLASLYTQLRAAENGKWVVRATNTGKTMIVDDKGRIRAAMDSAKRGYLIGEVIPNTKTTFYTRHGNLLLNLALAIIALLLINDARKSPAKKARAKRRRT